MSTSSPAVVLVVDDDEDFLWVVEAAYLGPEAAFRIVPVRSANDAMRFLAREPPFEAEPMPVAIVLDYHLQDTDGAEAFALMRSRFGCMLPPVILVSQYLWAHDEARLAEVGANAVRQKPSSISALRALIQQTTEGATL